MNQTHKIPPMTAVASSNLAAVGHDGTAMFVRFKKNDGSDGALYRYESAGRDVHDDLVGSKSPGQHFLKHIKGAHEGERVDGA
jgi:hypothetical protein